MHILVTRPADEAASFKADLEALGHRVTVSPLLEIEFLEPAISLEGVTALVATSRNALKSLARHDAFEAAKALPLYVVGPSTKALAESLGFADVIAGPAAAPDLVPVIVKHVGRSPARLLHLAGDTLAFDLEAALAREGVPLAKAVLYGQRPADSLTPAAIEAIRVKHLHAIVLMSPRVAMIFTDLVARSGLASQARDLCYICLSKAIAEGLRGLGPRNVNIAARPNMQEVLALIGRLAPDFA